MLFFPPVLFICQDLYGQFNVGVVSCGDRPTEEIESSQILSDLKDPTRELYFHRELIDTIQGEEQECLACFER